MAISTFLQQLASELAGKPEALAVVEQYRSALKEADTQKNKDKLILLQDQMHAALAVALSAPVDPDVVPNPDSPNSDPQTTSVDSVDFGITRASFMVRINTIFKLSLSEKEKLRQMVDGYALSTATAQELDPSIQIKPIKEVLEVLLQLSAEKLVGIIRFAKPTLLVTPRNDLDSKKREMDNNAKYENGVEASIDKDIESPFLAVANPSKVTVSIVDGAQHMPHIQGIPSDLRFDQRKLKFKEHYQEKGMKLINAHEYAMLMQRSLEEYKQSGNSGSTRDTSKILDFYYKDANDTITCLDDEYLSSSPHVACGFFHSGTRRVEFGSISAGNISAYLRGRPSVQVMEY